MKTNNGGGSTHTLLSVCDKHLNRFKEWTGGNNHRLYISDCKMTSIYSTRKCKQNVYVDLKTFEVICYTDCPAQTSQWERNESARVIEALQPFARLLRILFADRNVAVTTPAEILINHIELENVEVEGYTTEWRNVRIPINAYGKLADRNRMFITFLKTNKSDAPRNFVELLPDEYQSCKEYYRSGEVMAEPYTEASVYIDVAITQINRRNAMKTAETLN